MFTGILLAVAIGAAPGPNAFALDLYRQTPRHEGNLVVSPWSVSDGMVMALRGARGDTRAQMEAALRTTGAPHAPTAVPSIAAAGALWGQRGFGFLESFRQALASAHDARLAEVDFEKDPAGARRAINEWIGRQTNGRIREMIREEDLDPSVVLLLASAIDFEGRWDGPFDPALTAPAPFRADPDRTIDALFMHRTAMIRIARADDADLIELPYADGRLAMVVVLPKAPGGLAALEAGLDSAWFDAGIAGLERAAVAVSLPRFSVGSRLDLTDTLRAMGMTDAFTRRADFSGMSGRRGLFISKVIHGARVSIDEQGTRASAGSAVRLSKGPGPAVFTADRPFLFLVRDRDTGLILFLGRVADPQA